MPVLSGDSNAAIKDRALKRANREPEVRRRLYLALFTWSLIMAAYVALPLYYSFARWWICVMSIFCTFLTVRYGGIDNFQVEYYNRYFNGKKKGLKKKD